MSHQQNHSAGCGGESFRCQNWTEVGLKPRRHVYFSVCSQKAPELSSGYFPLIKPTKAHQEGGPVRPPCSLWAFPRKRTFDEMETHPLVLRTSLPALLSLPRPGESLVFPENGKIRCILLGKAPGKCWHFITIASKNVCSLVSLAKDRTNPQFWVMADYRTPPMQNDPILARKE